MDISIVMNCHKEGKILKMPLEALSNSLAELQKTAIKYEVLLIADSSNSETLNILENFVSCNKYVNLHFVFFNNLSLSRNYSVDVARGEYLAFIDGDDFWSSNYILDCYHFYQKIFNDKTIILHPEIVAEIHENSTVLWRQKKSKHRHLINLLEYNLWTSSVFAPKNVFRLFPYKKVDQDLKIGFEDWEWNVNTIMNGCSHDIVKNSVHYVNKRIRSYPSLSNLHEGNSHMILEDIIELSDNRFTVIYYYFLRVLNWLLKGL